MPKISVVIPAYNCASFLPATLESVFSQTYTDLETIVVDDGSTDETPAVMAPYLDRVQYLRQQNKGLPGARNTGIRAAKGDYIALLDADDAWMPTKLEEQMPRFADAQVGLVYTDFLVRYADGRSIASYLADRPLAAEGFILDSYLRSRYLFPSTMILRRECLESCGLFDEEMLACEDVELFARICVRWKAALVAKPLMMRYEGGSNITANTKKLNEYMILALRKIVEKEPGLPDSVKKTIAEELGRQYWWQGYAAFERGETKAARHSLSRAMFADAQQSRKVLPVLAASFLPGAVLRRLRRRR